MTPKRKNMEEIKAKIEKKKLCRSVVQQVEFEKKVRRVLEGYGNMVCGKVSLETGMKLRRRNAW